MTGPPSHTIYRSDTLAVDFFEHAPRRQAVAVTFTWLSNRELDGLGYGGRFLAAQGFDVVAFKSAADRWFQDVPRETIATLCKHLDRRDYARRAGYGASMGGTAAIQFSGALKLNCVLAYSPQYRIDMAFDTQFAPYADGLAWRYPIDPSSIARECRYFLAYDPYDIDRHHIARIGSVIPPHNLHQIRLPFAGHLSSHFLSDTGLLKPLCASVLGHDAIPDIGFRQRRRQSQTYLAAMARRAKQRGRKQLSLNLIDQAIVLAPRNLEHLLLRSENLFDLGRHDEALRDLRRAAELSHDDPYRLATLSHMLGMRGDDAAALAAIGRAIELDPTLPAFHAHREAVGKRMAHHQAKAAAAVRKQQRPEG